MVNKIYAYRVVSLWLVLGIPFLSLSNNIDLPDVQALLEVEQQALRNSAIIEYRLPPINVH